MVFGEGCARSDDWIERTLVTVDVAGEWARTWTTRALVNEGTGQIWLTLQQSGPKVTGQLKTVGRAFGSPKVDGPLEGIVSGDMFSFHYAGGRLDGAAQVTGDEMIGSMQGDRGDLAINLRRQQ